MGGPYARSGRWKLKSWRIQAVDPDGRKTSFIVEADDRGAALEAGRRRYIEIHGHSPKNARAVFVP